MPLSVVGSNGKRFITDFGESLTAVAPDGEEFHIPRYGIWHCSADRKPTVIHTTDFLDKAEDIMNEGIDTGWPTLYKPTKEK